MALEPARRVIVVRDVIRHHHAVVADISQFPDDFAKVHVPVVGVYFLKVIPTALNISQMDIEYLLPLSHPADNR